MKVIRLLRLGACGLILHCRLLCRYDYDADNSKEVEDVYRVRRLSTKLCHLLYHLRLHLHLTDLYM